MTRFFIQLSISLVALFIGVVIAIHLRPSDGGKLRAFLLLSQDCPAPCFIGIRPGVTTFKEALDRIRDHEWIQRINTRYLSAGREWFSFTWNGEQPDIIDDTRTPSIQGKNGIVQAIAIPVQVPIGEIFADWGTPVWSNGSISGLGLQYSVGFQDVPLQVGFVFTKNPRKIRYMLASQKVTLYYSAAVPDTIKPTPSLMDFINLKALTSWE